MGEDAVLEIRRHHDQVAALHGGATITKSQAASALKLSRGTLTSQNS
jgi:hypothetical protein